MTHRWLRIAKRLLRHRWFDEADARRAVPAEMLERLMRRVTASEQRHSGEVVIHVETSLPTSYLLREAPVRERALQQFGKLRVWDTEHNNGVLIYLLLAERAIEIVADRALAQKVPPQDWTAMVEGMAQAFAQKRFEDGLTRALEEVSALLVTHFPSAPGETNRNELPDEPQVD